ncbi:chitobiase/beta-hexosaminidase C-terminal domain-containing protein [Methanobacterium petrolearium]|uniref:chitobiase/beta-hexosaminidase C-terminal domain-containing protein n=1 Tax=Methanobacterium petrolearium TaxID=710190 RepID=UPI001AE8263F|nr:chitobiase/beta-hexosaminidase C-terminal domain-containing protein [Methanobacterium petrolearium]MBP1945717.1 parallel beta-helix repeat protein [Methanobacterium petrolearium]BDZ71965.1 hypothetical protein GCM10025861_24820 [Methanobacterium petrolearium]
MIIKVKWLILMVLFSCFLTMGVVSAANLTVSAGDSIQSAVNSASENDTIIVNDDNGTNYTYTENVVINKKVNLQAASNLVTVQALSSSNPVFTINNEGSGSSIQGLIINGRIWLNDADNCLISGNIINYSADHDILVTSGDNNNITGNVFLKPCYMSICIENSYNNSISHNNITIQYSQSCGIGVYSSSVCITKNNIISASQYMGGYGIYSTNSNITVTSNTIIGDLCLILYNSFGTINFNWIVGNIYGDFGAVNATNNWWGSGVPGFAGSWLVLNVTVTPLVTNGNFTVNVDLTHNNNGEDISSIGYIPDGTLVEIDIVDINGSYFGVYKTAYVYNGRAVVNFGPELTTSGIFFIETWLDSAFVENNITIDLNPPVVNASLTGGIYNSTKTVTLTASDNIDANPVIYYSINNGTTWNSHVKTVTLNLVQGVTNLKFYACDAAGNSGTNQTITYTIDLIAPAVAANPVGGVYNTTKIVTLTATDNLDPNPTIYYTTNGSTPTTASTIYTNPITIANTTTLKFIAVDNAGNQGPVNTKQYIFGLIGNINTGISYSSIQAAIDDPLTLNGHVIEVSNGTYTENVVVNKNLTILSSGNVTVQALDSSHPVFTINSGGSGSLIQGFIISGSVNYSIGLFLNGTSNCTISGNNITNNYFGITTQNTKTENNIIMYNTITLNQGNGLAIRNSDNCVIYGNTITDNNLEGNVDFGFGGVIIIESNNCTIYTNLIMGHAGFGISISDSNNILIQNNLIPGNMYGLYIEGCENCTVYENSITEGIIGIWNYYSSPNISFNRIAANTGYGLYNEYGNVNANNNWWGSNNPINSTNIHNVVGTINTTSWLILSINDSTVNSGGNASITADLTHNNLGQDTSFLGHVIKGLPITFTTSYGTILTPALTFNGKAVAILNLGTTSSRTVTVNTSLDNQTVSQQMVIAPGSAVLNITSSALNSTTLQPISLICDVPLNSSVTWLSVLWKNTDLFYGELQVIVNGTIVSSTEYVNPGYNTWKNSGYRDDVFRAIIYANNYILQDGMDPEEIPASFWTDLTSLYSLNSTELQFVQNHRLEFMDSLTVQLTYPGADAPVMTVTDPATNSTIDLNFTGGTVLRTSPIMYMDGLFGAGYEGVKSFAIATTKVTDEIAQYWADQKNATNAYGNLLYPPGAMKAAYGTFFTSLMMIYCHDILADTAAEEFNVTWSRTHPVAVSVGDDAYQTYLTLECDHSMGMTVIGSLKNTILFNSACSSQISTIEYGIMRNLDFTSQYETVSLDVMGSVTRDMFYAFWTGTDLELFTQNGYTIKKLVGRDDLILLYDPETGIMRDINTVNGFCGAYCFHDQITEQSYNFFDDVYNSTSDFREWANDSVEDYNWFMNHFNWEKFYHIGGNGFLLIAAGLALTGEIIAIPETVGGSILLMGPTIVTIYMSGNDMIDWVDEPTFKE